MPRQNLCPNPACGANITGYGGASVPARMTGLTGFPVGTGARWTAGTFAQIPTAAASAGVTYTLSMYARNNTGFDANNRTLYLAFTRSSGGDDFSNTVLVSLPNGVATRVSHTVTAPANTTGAYLLLDGVNAALGTGLDITACLAEASGTLDTYFDGGSPGASWDGTPDNSTSTLADPVTVIPAGIPVPVTLGQPSTALLGATPSGILVPVALGAPAVALGRVATPTGLAVPVSLGVIGGSLLEPGILTPGGRPAAVLTPGGITPTLTASGRP